MSTWCHTCGVMEATHYYPEENLMVCRDHRFTNRSQDLFEAMAKGLKYETVLTTEAADYDKVTEKKVDDPLADWEREILEYVRPKDAPRDPSDEEEEEDEWVWATEELKEGDEFQKWWSEYRRRGDDVFAYGGVVVGTSPRRMVRITSFGEFTEKEFKSWCHMMGTDPSQPVAIDHVQPFTEYKVKAKKDSKAVAAFKEVRTLLDSSEQQKWEEVHANDIRVGDIIRGAGRHSSMYEGKYRWGNTSRQGKVVRLATETERRERVACWIHEPHEEQEVPIWSSGIYRLVQVKENTQAEWPDTIVYYDGEGEYHKSCGYESEHFCCKGCNDPEDLCTKCKVCVHCTKRVPEEFDRWGDPRNIRNLPCAAGGNHEFQDLPED